jgi:MFS family permease
LTKQHDQSPAAFSVAGHATADKRAWQTARRAELKHGWLALLTAFVGVAAGVAALQAHSGGVMFLPIIKSFGWTRAQLSLGQTSFTLLTMATTPFAGALVDRFGVRRVAAVSIVGCAAVFFLLSRFQGDLWRFVLVMAALGLIGAGNSAVVYVALVTLWFDRMRGFAIGVAMAGSGVSAIITSKLVIPYVAQAGWRMGYQALAIVMLATVPLVLVGARPSNVEPLAAGAPESAAAGLTLREALRTSRFWRLALAMCLMGTGLGGFYVHFVPMITDRGLAPAQAANAAAIFGFAVLSGRLIAGYLLDRIFAPLVGALTLVLALAGLGSLLPGGTIQILPVAAAIGLAFGTELDVAGYVTGRYFGRRAYGKIYGWQFSMFAAGGLVSPLAYGLVHDRTDSYGYALAGSMVMLSAAILALLSLGPYPARFSRQ